MFHFSFSFCMHMSFLYRSSLARVCERVSRRHFSVWSLFGGEKKENSELEKTEKQNSVKNEKKEQPFGPEKICVCGLSKNQPICDGSHKAVGFRSISKGTIPKFSDTD